MVNWTGVARRTAGKASSGGKGGSTFPSGAGLGVVCALATVIALPAIGYSYGESAATARQEAAHPAHDLLWSNEPSIPSTAYLDVPDPLSAARAAADSQRAQAAYWKSQTVTVPRSTSVSSGGGSSSVSSVSQPTRAQAQPKPPKAAPAPKQAAQPKAPRQAAASKASQPSTTVTVTQTQSTSTTAKGTTTTKNSTSTKTTTKG